MPPDSITSFAFNDSIAISYGYYDLCAFVNLVDDADTCNNSLCKSIHGTEEIEEVLGFVLSQSVEGGCVCGVSVEC
ncbi:hypothetical protein ACFLRZ_04215 [Bacteroidota bacterium]